MTPHGTKPHGSAIIGAEENSPLARILREVAYPAWIENERSVVLHANHHQTLGPLRLDDDLRRRVSIESGGRRATDGLRFVIRHANAVLSVAVYPIVTDHLLPPVRLRMLVVCLGGDEPARDRAMAWLFWSSLLKSRTEDNEEELTPRQKLIYRLLKAGYSYKEIAAELKVAHSTVRVQVAQIRKILGPHKVALLRRDRGCRE